MYLKLLRIGNVNLRQQYASTYWNILGRNKSRYPKQPKPSKASLITPFRATEDVFAQGFMTSSNKYKLNPNCKDWARSTNFAGAKISRKCQELSLELENICQKLRHRHSALEVDEFAQLSVKIKNIEGSLTGVEIEEMLEVFTRVPTLPEITYSRSYAVIRNTLNDACMSNYKEWNLKTILHIAKLFSRVAQGQKASFLNEACLTVASKMESMSSAEMVEALYALKFLGKSVCALDRIEEHLEKKAPEICLEELTIALMVYYRSGIALKSQTLISTILIKMLNADLNILPGVALTGLLKILRLSLSSNQIETAMALMERLTTVNLDAMGISHALLFASQRNVHCEAFLEMATNKYMAVLDTARLKDIAILTTAIIKFDYTSKATNDLFENIMKKLCQNKGTAKKFPESFISCVINLAIRNYSQPKLLTTAKLVANPDGVLQSSISSSYPYHLLLLDSIIRINMRKSSDILFLNDEQRIKLIALHCCDSNKKPNGIEEIAADLYGHVKSYNALPYLMQNDIFIIMDRQQQCNASTSNEFLNEAKTKLIDKITLIGENDNLEVVVLVYLNESAYFKTNTANKMTGIERFRIEQLKLLGFLPAVIPYYEWKDKPPRQKQGYLLDKVIEVLNEKSHIQSQ